MNAFPFALLLLGTFAFTAVAQQGPFPSPSPVWKSHYNILVEQPLSDADADGVPEWEEGAFGTSPLDPLSVPALILQPGAPPTLSWPSVKGARVQPESSATLASWQAHGPPLTGNGTSINIPLPTDGSARYFRLRSMPLLDADGDGLNTLEEALLGTSDAPEGSGSVTVAAGSEHTLALKTDGSLWAWGKNRSGQLGDGTTVNKSSPIRIGSDNNWKAVTAGRSHTLALKTDGSLWAWGGNNAGQLGDGPGINKTSPVRIGSTSDWKAVTAGDLHTLALKTDGSLWSWGYNFYGHLGDGTTSPRTSPVRIGSAIDWNQVTAGSDYSFALKTDGSL